MKFKGTFIAILALVAIVGFSTGDCRIKAPTCGDFALSSFIGVDTADARRSGGGSSFGGSRSSFGGSKSSSWGSKSKSSSWGSKSTSKPSKSVSLGKKDTTKKSSFSSKTNSGITKQKSTAARKKYTSMQHTTKPTSKLTTAPKTQARAKSYMTRNTSRSYTSRHDYYRARDTYYSGYRTPVYINTMPYSSFGMWDVLWLSMILDNMHDRNNAQWMYNHQNDPGVQQYRAEMQKMAAENAEVKAKLTKMDAEMAAMKGQPVDPNYMVPGVDPSVAMAPDLVESQIPEETSYAWMWWLVFGGVLVCGVAIWYLW